MKSNRIIIWGLGQLGITLIKACAKREDVKIVAAKTFSQSKHGRDLGVLADILPIKVNAEIDKEKILNTDADCVFFVPAAQQADADKEADLIDLLKSGKNVITTCTFDAATIQRLKAAAVAADKTLHFTGIYPGFMVERLLLTLTRALTQVDHIRFVEALDLSEAPSGFWGDLKTLGFGQKRKKEKAVKALTDVRYGYVIERMAKALFNANATDIRIEQNITALPAAHELTIGKLTISEGATSALHIVHNAYLGDKHFFTAEECWYLGEAFRGHDLPFGNFKEAVSYAIQLTGGLTKLSSQLEFEKVTDGHPYVNVAVKSVLDALTAVISSDAGLLLNDATPRYQNDTRIRA